MLVGHLHPFVVVVTELLRPVIGDEHEDVHLVECAVGYPPLYRIQFGKIAFAVDRGFGEKKETDFFTIVLWNKQAETLHKYCSKGDKITVIGKLQTRSYELKNGEKRTVYEIRVDELDLPPKNAAKQAEPEFSQPSMDDMMGTDDFPF